jgi:hypothetical protein
MNCEAERNFSKLKTIKKQISIDNAGGKTELSLYSAIENYSKFTIYDEAIKEYEAKKCKYIYIHIYIYILRSESGS